MVVDEQPEDALLAAAFAKRQGSPRDKEDCVRVLDRHLGRRLERYFIRHRVPEHAAEEMVWDVWLKVLNGDFRGETRPVIWIWIIARNGMRDYHRRESPEVNLDDQDWDALLGALPASDLPAWVRLCIERALWQFEQDHPERAETLRMLAEEWSADEVGQFFECAPGAARDRVYQARRRVKPYLDECRETA